MNDIILRNPKSEDVNDMLNFNFISPIREALKYKSICSSSYVAELDKKIIGIIICEKSLLGSYDIKIIEVNSKYRNQGVGKKLINKIKELANDKAITVYYPNQIEKFYSKNGFIIGDNVKVALFQSKESNC